MMHPSLKRQNFPWLSSTGPVWAEWRVTRGRVGARRQMSLFEQHGWHRRLPGESRLSSPTKAAGWCFAIRGFAGSLAWAECTGPRGFPASCSARSISHRGEAAARGGAAGEAYYRAKVADQQLTPAPTLRRERERLEDSAPSGTFISRDPKARETAMRFEWRPGKKRAMATSE